MEESMQRNASLSPKASQPTPFSIADILSRRTSPEQSKDDKRILYHDSRLEQFLGLPSPELSVVKELDMLRRNLVVQANLASFASLPQIERSADFASLAGYQHRKEMKMQQRQQQDEALDMSKSKYLGENFAERGDDFFRMLK